MAERKRGLGRGLSALIGETTKKVLDEAAPVAAQPKPDPTTPSGSASGGTGQGFQLLGIDQLVPGKFQPRRHFDNDELRALATSLEKSGVLQPLLVRPLAGASNAAPQFEIIAGERRWRAAQMAKLHNVPVIIQDLSDSVALEVGIIENVQRADLNPIEEAEGYQRLIEEFAYTQAELAETIGKSRSHIANILRLTSATPKVREGLIMGTLSMGHARALLGHPQADQLVKKIIADGLSVRAVETLVAQTKPDSGKTGQAKSKANAATKSADTRALEKTLGERLGLKVTLDDKGDGSGGQLHIEYKSLEQLDALITHLLTRHD